MGRKQKNSLKIFTIQGTIKENLNYFGLLSVLELLHVL